MSERAPYSRVYWSIIDDRKFVDIYDDDAALSLWLRLLIAADALWPAPAPLPRGTRSKPLAKLVDARLIVLLPGDRYKVHGLDKERGKRTDSARNAAASRWHTSRSNDTDARRDETSRDELNKDETSQAEPTRTRGWDDPEGEALTWLAKHGCAIRPGDGYHQKLVVAVERHGINALIGMLDRLSDAGTRDGDIKGLLFGAIDALDARTRPKVSEIEAQERAVERDADFQRRVERTKQKNRELREWMSADAAARESA